MVTNPHDTFRDQSRSPNMVLFDMLGMVSYYCVTLSLCDIRLHNAMTLKTGLGSIKVIGNVTIR